LITLSIQIKLSLTIKFYEIMKDEKTSNPQKGNASNSSFTDTALREKEEFQEQAQHLIDKVHAKIGELESKTNLWQGTAKQKYQSSLEKLKAEEKRMQNKYHDLKAAAGDKWQETKKSFQEASTSFEKGLKEVQSIVD